MSQNNQTFSDIVYPATFEVDGSGTFVITFRDIPEAIAQGDDWKDANEMAADALSTALEFYFEDNRSIPTPSAFQSGEVAISLSTEDANLMRAHNAKERPLEGWVYRVEINCLRNTYCMNEEEVWAALGRRGIGDTYFVYDRDGNTSSQFVSY